MGLVPWFLFLSLHCWCIGMQPISVHWFYILQLWWIRESSLSVLWWNLLGFPYRVKSKSLTSSWPIWMPFISLCWLIAEAKTSNTMLNNSGESGHPCLVPDLWGKALSFSPLRMILALGRSYMAFRISRYYPSIPTSLRDFIKKGCCILLNAFSAPVERIIWFLSFLLLMWWITLIVLWILNYPCIPRYISHLVVVNNFFNVLLDLVG